MYELYHKVKQKNRYLFIMFLIASLIISQCLYNGFVQAAALTRVNLSCDASPKRLSDPNTLYVLNCNGLTINGNSDSAAIEVPDTRYEYHLEVHGTINLNGGNASGTKGATAGIHIPKEAVLNISGDGTINAKGGNAANGGDGSNGERTNSDSKNPDYRAPGGSGGGGAAAGIGGNGGNGGGSNRNGSSGEDSGSLIMYDSVHINATGGSGGKGGKGGKGKGSVYGTAAIIQGGYAGGGGGGGGGAGYPAAGFGGGGAGGGGGGSAGTSDYVGVSMFAGIVYDRAYGGGGGGGGAGYGPGGGGGAGNDARVYQFPAPSIFDPTNNDGGDGAAAGNAGGDGGETHVKGSAYQGQLSGDAGTGGRNNQPGSGGKLDNSSYGNDGAKAGNAGNGGYYIYCNELAGYSARRQLTNSIAANAEDVGSGGGVNKGYGSSQVKMYDLANATINITPEIRGYNGDSVIPKITIYGRDGSIIPSDSYDVTMNPDFVNVGDYKASITGKASMFTQSYLTGTRTVDYHVTIGEFVPAISLSSSKTGIHSQIVASVLNNDSKGEVTWIVEEGSAPVTLSSTTGESIIITADEVGKVKLHAQISETRNYKAAISATKEFEVTPEGVENFQLSGILDKPYTGSAITQDDMQVKFKEKVLTLHKDYEVSYENNVSRGEASMTITGINDYEGEITTCFYITRANIADAQVKAPSDLVFTGYDQSSAPSISYKGIPLIENVDYTLNYDEYLNGDVNVTISGMGNFMGTNTTSYTIQPADIATLDEFIIEPIMNMQYTGSALEPDVRITFLGKNMTEGVDYELSYSDNVQAGNGIVTVTGKGSFKGSRSMHFTIDKAPLEINPDSGQWKYGGAADTPLSFTYTGALHGDSVTFKDGTALSRKEGEELGTYEITLGNLALADNAVSQNYELTLGDKVLFEIRAFETDEEATLEGELGNNDWYYKQKVKIKAPEGYLISFSNDADGTWSDYVTFGDGDYTKDGIPYYLKAKTTGYISQSKNIKFKQDTISPDSRIQVNKIKSWTGMYEFPKFQTYFSAKTPVEINTYGDDDLSLMDSVERYVSDQILDEDDLKALSESDWNAESDFTLTTDGKYIIYTRLKDRAGNISYGRSDGFLIDSIDPEVSYTYAKEGTWTSEEQPAFDVSVKDDNSGLKDRYVDYTINGKIQLVELNDHGKASLRNLPDGDYSLLLHAQDNAGNQRELPVHVMKDTKTPRISVQGDTTGYAVKQPITITPETGASGIDKIYVQYVKNSDDYDPDGSWIDITDDYLDDHSYNAEKNGTYYFKVQSVVGLSSEVTSISFTRIDATKPVVNVQAHRKDKTEFHDNEWTNDKVTIDVRNDAKNLGSAVFEYKLNDSAWRTLDIQDGVGTLTMEKQGQHTYTLRITSASGVVSEEKEFHVNIDKVLPSAAITIEDNHWSQFLNLITLEAFFNKTVDAEILSSDEESGIHTVKTFVMDGDEQSLYGKLPQSSEALEAYVKEHGGWTDGSTRTLHANEKHNVIYARVSDHAGNVKYVSSEGFTLDTQKPEILIQTAGESDFGGGVGRWFTEKDSYVQVSMNDALSGIAQAGYQIDDAAWVDVESLTTFMINDLKEGCYDIKVRVKDMAGNTDEKIIPVQVDTQAVDVKLAQGDPDAYASYQNVIVKPIVGSSGIKKVETQFVEEGENFSHTKWNDVTSTYTSGERIVKKGTFYARVMNNLGEMETSAWTFDRIQFIQPDLQSEVMNKDDKAVKQDCWINPQGYIQFHNTPQNVMNFTYEYQIDHGAWLPAAVDNRKIAVISAQDIPEGRHTITLRIGNENANSVMEYDSEDVIVCVDKSLPEGELILGDYDSFEHLVKEDQKTSSIQSNNRIQEFYANEKGIFLNDVKDVSASENSGLESISYYVQRSNIAEYLHEFPSTEQEIEAFVNNRWTQMSAAGWEDNLEAGITYGLLKDLGLNRSYVVYVKLADKAGNVSYVSTRGFALDNTKPVIQTDYEENGWITEDAQSIRVSLIKSLGGMAKGSYDINGTPHTVGSDDIIDDMYFDIPMSSLIDGENIITIRAENRIGTKADDVTLSVKKDIQKPEVRVSGDTMAYALAQKITVTPLVGSSKLFRLEMRKDNEAWQDITQTYDKGIMAEKNGTYSFRVSNNAKVTSNITSIVFDRIESDPPVVKVDAESTFEDKDAIHYDEGTWTNKDVEMNVRNMQSNYGVSTYEYSTNDRVDWNVLGTSDDSDEQLTIREENPGVHYYNFRIRSQLGLISNIRDVSVKIDKGTPVAMEAVEENGWSRESKLRVKASDDLSGFGVAAYSFDGGESFQNTPSAVFDSNQDVDIVIRDQAGNETGAKGVVSHVDNLAPGIASAKQDSDAWKKSKRVTAVIKDSTATAESGQSGVEDVFLTAHNPYRGSTLVRTEPMNDDIIMRASAGSDVYTSAQPITTYYGDEDSDNYWIIAKDTAGNAVATSLCVNRIDGFKQPDTDPEPDKKPDGEDDGSQKPDTEKPGNKPDSDGNSDSGNGSTGEPGKPSVDEQIKDIEDGISQSDKESGKDSDKIQNDLTDLLDKVEDLLKDDKLSAEEKAELLKQKQEILDRLVNTIYEQKVSNDKQSIKSTMDLIDELLERDDLSAKQRKMLQEKKTLLNRQYEKLGGNRDEQMLLISLLIVALVLLGGSIFTMNHYRKKTKKLKKENEASE